MINKETIISVYNEKLTLVQWLKSVNKALDEAVLTNVEIAQRGNATFVFVFTFEDGTQVESNEIIVNQGESINGASIRNGHLYLSLTNGDELDAGNVKPVSSFSFNSSRHLIVYYGDGTNQDLGLIKGISSFSINSSGHLIATYDDGTTEDVGSLGDFSNVDLRTKTLGQSQANWGDTPYVSGGAGIPATPIYNRFEVIGNILYVILNFKLVNNTGESKTIYGMQGNISVPSIYGEKIIDFEGDDVTTAKAQKTIICATKGYVFSDLNSTYFDEINLSLANATSANYVSIELASAGITIPNGETRYVTGRIALTLL